jgi:ABC-2 type transport system ATP-binding protein
MKVLLPLMALTSTLNQAVQQSIGYLPEHNPLYLDLYVREYLAFNADVYKVANPQKK